MAEKFCIFCGKVPQDKNLEHVIPQWLIKMTGRERKDVFTNFPEDHRHLNFMNFKFPACTKCNSKYAELEGKVRPIMVNVLEGKPITGADASLLMDWFDKVRIGLWLTDMYYNPEIKEDLQPHFYIDSRVGLTDRMLSIQRIDMNGKGHGISFIGTNFDMFQYLPSAFTLLINDVCFTNASTHNLVSPRVGFPIMEQTRVIDVNLGRFSFNLRPGRHKVTNPIIPTYIPNKDSITFYQPIMKEFADEPIVLNDSYVTEHCYDIDKGLGGVFVQKGNVGNIRYLGKDDKTGTKTKDVKTNVPNIIMDTIKIQTVVSDRNMVKSFETSVISSQYNKVLEKYKSVKHKMR